MGQQLVAEYSGSTVARRYVPGPGVDEVLVVYEGSGTGNKKWLHQNAQGSTIAVTNASGLATESYRYDPYGKPSSTTGVRFKYTGQIYLRAVGLYHYKARAYDPDTGRFLQTDPIGYGDGLNIYAYVSGDPVNMTDPTGTEGGLITTALTVRGAIRTFKRVSRAIKSIFGSGTKVTFKGDPGQNAINMQLTVLENSFNEQPRGGGTASGADAAYSMGVESPQSSSESRCASSRSNALRDFGWGAADFVLFGFGPDIRNSFGLTHPDTASAAYLGGQIAGGVAILATGVGGGLRAAGAAGRGLEFSHFIPRRMGGPRSIWNGNFVTIRTHALSDPFRYRFMPKWWKNQHGQYNVIHKTWARFPNVGKGAAAGAAAAGVALARSGCDNEGD